MKQIIFIRGGEAFYSKEQYYNYLEKREYNPYKKRKSWRDWILVFLLPAFPELLENIDKT